MKNIIGVRITNATQTGQTAITIVFEDENGNKTKRTEWAVIAKDTYTGETIYHADTIELDKAMAEFMATATRTEKNEGDKFAIIYK